ncbi:sugar porter family MFS transporter [Streptomyces sp. NPDC047002]|uniref:sugar porter family MFS transporter n=1 Tax=Streptomyces sp. NPDC047002 TaxID=3155475 RepID=UPI00345569AB
MTPTPSAPPVPGLAAPTRLRQVVLVAAAAAMGGFLFGYDSSVINGAVEAVRDRYDIGSAALAQVIAVALIGSAIGAAVAGRIADRIGRLGCMRIAAALFCVSSVGSALPTGIWDLSAWRVIGGFGIGMASVIGPAYIAEVAPPAYRGRLASFQQAAIVTGIAVSQLVNWLILRLAHGDQRGTLAGLEAWQWMLGVMVVPSLVYGLLSFVIPESPRHLIARGHTERARRILVRLEGEGPGLDGRIAEIRDHLASGARPAFRALRGPVLGLRGIVWVGIGMALFQQLVGINVAFYYSATLWQSVGIDPGSSFLYSFTTSLVNIVGTVVAVLLVDRVGRKPLVLFGSAGMAVSLACEAWAFSAHLVDGRLPHAQGLVALVAAHVFVLCFASSWGVVLWVMLGEMFPVAIRAAALGVSSAAVWVANWVITATFPSLSDWNLGGTYLIYTAFAALSLPFAAKFVRETRGRKLEDMG